MTFSIFDHVQLNKTGRAICPSCLITKGEGYRKYNLSVSLETATHGAYHCHRGCTNEQIRSAIGDAKPLEKTYIPTAKPPKEIVYKTADQIESQSRALRAANPSKNAPKALQYLLDRGLELRTIEYFKIGYTFKDFQYGDDWKPTPCIFIPYEIETGKWLGKYFPNKWLPEADRPDQQMAQPNVKARWYFTHEPEGKELWICEGEWDALLSGQKLYNNQSDISVCTATCGAGNIPKDLSPLAKYERIVIFYDLDDAGIKGAKDLKKAIGDRATIATTPAPLDFKKGFDIGDGFKEFGDRYLEMLHDAAKPILAEAIPPKSKQPEAARCAEQPKQENNFVFETPKQREMRVLRETYAHRLRLNIRGFEVELDGKTVEPDYLYLQCLERDGIEVKKDQIIDAFLFFASENQYDPVAEYLNQCYAKYGDSTIHLLDDASDRYMHTNEPVYNTYIRKTLIGGVLRTFEAGSQFETALILFSKTQGFFKSTFWRVLGGDWFDDTVQGFDRDERQKLHQYWIEEFGEIERVSTKHDVSQVKAFMSNRNDVFRVPFGRKSKPYARKFILVGSTNLPEVLQDSTGDRRFWIIKLDQPIDIEKVKEDRDKLWAAAVALYKRGETAFLPKDDDMIREELNKEHRKDDAWEEPIAEYVKFFDQVKMIDILKTCLDIPLERHEQKYQTRVATILRSLGFEKAHTVNGKVWKKQGSEESEGSIDSTATVSTMTPINIEESIINKGSELLNAISLDPLTPDPYDPSKKQKKQVEKQSNSFAIGDRVEIVKGFFVGATGTITAKMGLKLFVECPQWVQGNEFSRDELRVI